VEQKKQEPRQMSESKMRPDLEDLAPVDIVGIEIYPDAGSSDDEDDDVEEAKEDQGTRAEYFRPDAAVPSEDYALEVGRMLMVIVDKYDRFEDTKKKFIADVSVRRPLKVPIAARKHEIIHYPVGGRKLFDVVAHWMQKGLIPSALSKTAVG
jgi:hypothetical protein